MKRFFLQFVCFGLILAFLLTEVSLPTAGVAQVPVSANRPNPGAGGQFNSIIVDFQDTPSIVSQLPQALSKLRSLGLKPVLNSEFSQADNIYVMPGDTAMLSQLSNSALASQVEYMEPNYIYSQAGAVVNDPDYGKQWNLQQINIADAWAHSQGKGVTVAVIDTGVSPGPDMQQTKFVAGYDFVNDQKNATDDNGHGTHVAGTIAQSTNNRYGVAGVAYGAQIMPLKVLSRTGSGTVSDIAEAIRFAADNGADVINLSLGGGGESKLMREAIDHAHKKGVVVIAAAGNNAGDSAHYPALYPHVIGVSAVGPDGKKTAYSNYGEGVDIAAPGGTTGDRQEDGILQETINRRKPGEYHFSYLQGTSMAAPHVAGVAALVKASQPSLSPQKVEAILTASAQAIKGDSQNFYGAGLLNAAAAVKRAAPSGFSLNWNQFNFPLMSIKLLVASALTWLVVPRRSVFNPWRFSFLLGLITGSIGLFIIKAITIAPVLDTIARLFGSALPEMGNSISGDMVLNPIFASCLIPSGLMLLLISHTGLKWWTLGLSIGTIAFLGVTAFANPELWFLGTGRIAQIYLLGNAIVGTGLTALFMRVATDDAARGG